MRSRPDLDVVRDWVTQTEPIFGPDAPRTHQGAGFVTARAWWHDCHDFLELTDRLKELLRGAHVCALQGGYTHDDADLVAQIRTALGKTDRSDTETETAAATPDVVRPTCPSPTGGR